MSHFKLLFRNGMGKMPVWLRKAATRFQVRRLLRFIMSKEDREICEQFPEMRAEIVERYKKKYPKDAALVARKIERVFSTNDRVGSYSDIDIVKSDMEFCWFWLGFHPDEYMFFHFYEENKDLAVRKSFVSEQERWAFRFCANDFSDPLLSDKAETYKKLSSYYKRDAVVLERASDLEKFEKYVERHPVFVKKLVSSSRGKGVELIDSSEYPTIKACFEDILQNGKVLLEEKIVQNEEIAAFNGSSVNTVRISTFTTKNGILPAFGFFRTGRNGSFVDNAARGGVFATVDVENGLVCTEGCDEYGNRYYAHPDTNVQFKGFQLPDWSIAICLVKEAASLLPNYKYVSFDLAHFDRKWVIVEVNPSGQFIHQAGTLKGFRSNLKRIINQMDLFNPYELY